MVVVVSGDRKGSSFIEQWSPALEDSLAVQVKNFQVKFIPHAHLKGAPFFIKGAIKDKFNNKLWGEGRPRIDQILFKEFKVQ